MTLLEMGKFVLGFLGVMAIIGACLLIVNYIGKRDIEKKKQQDESNPDE